jgi:hypothetical protein
VAMRSKTHAVKTHWRVASQSLKLMSVQQELERYERCGDSAFPVRGMWMGVLYLAREYIFHMTVLRNPELRGSPLPTCGTHLIYLLRTANGSRSVVRQARSKRERVLRDRSPSANAANDWCGVTSRDFAEQTGAQAGAPAAENETSGPAAPPPVDRNGSAADANGGQQNGSRPIHEEPSSENVRRSRQRCRQCPHPRLGWPASFLATTVITL